MKNIANEFKIILPLRRNGQATIPLAALFLFGFAGTMHAQDMLITYQGCLTVNGSPANGTYDLRLAFYNDSTNGDLVAGPETNSATSVANGLFTVTAHSPPADVFITNTAIWLEIAARTNGSRVFTTLAPRQQMTATPYAVVANSLLGTLPVDQLSGTLGLKQLPGTVLTNNESGVTLGGVTLATLTLNGALSLPSITVSSPDIIYSGSSLLFYSDYGGNFFSGLNAGNLTTSGWENTANGVEALSHNTSGVENTANGYAALYSNTNGSQNTANGFYALYYNTSGSYNTANGSYALFDNTSGSYNTANGFDALSDNTSGWENTANGFAALYSNTNGWQNTANGSWALSDNTSGSNNTANGYQALFYNTTGSWNTANGVEALCFNTSGSYNTANGYQALFDNRSGSYNTANGFDALSDNTSGSGNTANGFYSLFDNTSGSVNTANGYYSLYNNTSGSANTAIGEYALSDNTSGNTNIALGSRAGAFLTTGSFNIDIGNTGEAGDYGIIRIGVQGNQTNTIIAGIWGVTVPPSEGTPVYINGNGQLGTATSSRRFKEDIKNMAEASEALYALRPVTFKYKPEIDRKGAPEFGLVAEEVAQADPNLVVRDARNQIYTVRYEAVNAMLLNEFLKQHREVQQQAEEIKGLKTRLEKLEQLMNERNRGAQ